MKKIIKQILTKNERAEIDNKDELENAKPKAIKLINEAEKSLICLTDRGILVEGTLIDVGGAFSQLADALIEAGVFKDKEDLIGYINYSSIGEKYGK